MNLNLTSRCTGPSPRASLRYRSGRRPQVPVNSFVRGGTRIGFVVTFVILLYCEASFAACMQMNGATYCGKGPCVEFNGGVYCSSHEGGAAAIRNGTPFCGAGKCLEKDGNMWCSEYPGGGIIRYNSALWSGPGECLVHDGNAYCAQAPRGECFVVDGSVRCQGGWVREKPVLANLCDRAPQL